MVWAKTNFPSGLGIAQIMKKERGLGSWVWIEALVKSKPDLPSEGWRRSWGLRIQTLNSAKAESQFWPQFLHILISYFNFATSVVSAPFH